jgi:hypothetical protein
MIISYLSRRDPSNLWEAERYTERIGDDPVKRGNSIFEEKYLGDE